MGNSTSKAGKGRNSEAAAQARHQHTAAMDRLRSVASHGRQHTSHNELMSPFAQESIVAQTERHMQREGKPFVAAELKVILLTLRPTERVHEMRVEDLRRAIRAVIVQTNLDRIMAGQTATERRSGSTRCRLPAPEGSADSGNNVHPKGEDPV